MVCVEGRGRFYAVIFRLIIGTRIKVTLPPGQRNE